MPDVAFKFLGGGTALVAALVAVLLGHQARAQAQPGEVQQSAEGNDFFEKRIRPVFVDRCNKCHGARAGKLKGGLSLESPDGVLKGGSSGPVVVPRDPEKSLLIRAIRYIDEDLKMPPPKEGKKLSDEQVADFLAWVKMGAPGPKVDSSASAARSNDSPDAPPFWSFQPLAVRSPPALVEGTGARGAVDQFILAKLQEKGLTPAHEADRRTLIRRATFDLIGLPPSAEEIDAFVRDQSPRAFEDLVERLLASPHYGERWGRHWLDVARYADTAGDSSDFPIPQAYRYRNYVIDSFNRDKPYDRFLREQIAGDLLPAGTETERIERIIATGYLAIARRPGIYPERTPHLVIEDMIETLGRSVLGLGLGCARCHDHKFDPITTADYYALYGIFASTRWPHTGSTDSEGTPYQKDLVLLRAPSAKEKPMVEAHFRKLAALETEINDRYSRGLDAPTLRKERHQILARRPALEEAMAVSEGTPQNARIQMRGDPLRPGDEVPRRFLRVFGGDTLSKDERGSGRRELPEWLTTGPARALTARVMVNRIWQHHFGKGIVQTPDDFGRRGRAPTHPELLDYLAARFIESGWSVKAMHRLMMLSEIYRQSAAGAPENAHADPSNDLLWTFNRRRLSAEELRDAWMFVSRDLNPTMSNETHPFPPMTSWWGFSCSEPFAATYDSNHRSVYLMQARSKRHPLLEVFDGPNPSASTGDRRLSTTPLQALFLMNDDLVIRQSHNLADLVIAQHGQDEDRIQAAYRAALGRLPLAEEREVGLTYLGASRQLAQVASVPAHQEVRKAWASYVQTILVSNEFIFVD